MVEDQDRTVAKKLFGGIRKLPVTGPHQPTAEQLKELLQLPEPDDGAINVFCRGCGHISCINQLGLKGL